MHHNWRPIGKDGEKSVPDMKRTVVITIKYYDNFNDFGTIPVLGYTFYLQFSTGKRTWRPFFNAKDVG